MVEPDRPQMTTWRMLVACWITTVTITRSEYVRLFFTEKIVTRKLLNVHFLSCLMRLMEGRLTCYTFFLRGVTKNSSLTGCDAASLDEWLPTFRRDVCT